MRRPRIAIVTIVLACIASARTADARAPAVPLGSQYPGLVLPAMSDGAMNALDGLAGRKVILLHFSPASEDGRRLLTTWNRRAAGWRDRDDLSVVAVAHEQHAERVRLLVQWKRVTIPVWLDPLNQSMETASARVYCLDGQGFVRAIDPDSKALKSFLKKKYKKKDKGLRAVVTSPPSLKVVQRRAGESRGAAEWRLYGDVLYHSGEGPVLNEAIRTYETAITFDADDAWSHFRLAVALRRRYDGGERQEGDLAAAIAGWRKAAKLVPENELFALRAAQFDESVAPLENMYGWVAEARKEIESRGETPVALAVEPTPREMMGPEGGNKRKKPGKRP